MALLENINFFTTVLACGCFSFAVTNFGIKLGKLRSFKNTSGYQYISNSSNKNKIYESIIETDKPDFAKDADALEKWCLENQKSARWWKDTSKYCLIRNNVRHQLIKDGYTLKQENAEAENENPKCSEILEMYADDTKNTLGYLLGKNKCFDAPTSPSN